MPVKDSTQSETRDGEPMPESSVNVEEIETPIETTVTEQAEHEFETERKIPKSCKKAIVSVDGKDVEQVPLPDHERAA
ncbi:MAG TPA: hypothetical protein VGL89_03985 [Candidatus Koribacter sp.]